MADLIQLRRDTAANWTSVNPVLADGEAGIEKDTKKFKVGDGSTAWNSLPYQIGDTDLSYDAETRLLSSSSGDDVTLPLASESSDGLMAVADKTKLDGIEAGAEVNVQPDWDATTGDAAIQNKPTLGTAAAEDVGTSAGNVVQLDEAAKLPAVDGSQLTNLPASGAIPAGSGGQIQFHDGQDPAGLGASDDLTWDDTAKELGVGGDINLDDGGTYTTTVQCITPTQDRVISFPDRTGTVALIEGSSGQIIWNNGGVYGGVTGSVVDVSGNITLGSRLASSQSGAASAPPVSLTGTWFTGGTTTTTKPQFLIEPAGTTSTGWSTSGTGLGVNAPSGFAGRILDLQLNGSSVANFSSSGSLSLSGSISTSGNISFASGSRSINYSNGSLSIIGSGTGARINLSPANGAVEVNNGSGTLAAGTVGGIDGASYTSNGGNVTVRGGNAIVSGHSNSLTGGHIYVKGGDGGSSSATGNARGGNVYLDGGQAYGTGLIGNVIVGSTRGNLQIADSRNIVLGSTTGTKIGTATTQKLGFYNATPVVQQGLTTDLLDALQALGLIASGTGDTPLNLGGGALVCGTVNATSFTGSASGLTGLPAEIGVACSDETTVLTAGAAKVTFRMPYAMTLTAVRASVNTAPTGSTLIVDINEGGTSVLGTKLSIDAGETTNTTADAAATITDTALADDAQITIDIDQVGSTIAGAGLKIWLIGTRA